VDALRLVFIKLLVGIFSLLFLVLVIAALIEVGGSAIWSLILGIPFVASLFYFYRYMDRFDAHTHKSSSDTYSATPSSSSPFTQNTPPRQDIARAYRICHFMWIRSIIFCKQIQGKPELLSQIYIWTVFFYSLTKHIRNQKIVDEIYSQFKVAAECFIPHADNKVETLEYIHTTYRRFRIELNKSGIDPRTRDGMSKLWRITVQWAFPDLQIPEDAEGSFFYNSKLLVNHALTLYNLKPQEEIVYYLEAANGMTVRVPESKLEAWQEAQECFKNSPKSRGRTEQEKLFKERIIREIYGSQSENQ
jgi:hypothetical protein